MEKQFYTTYNMFVMTNSIVLSLKAIIVLVALVVLIGMIRVPQTEGRAANLDLISIYSDPLILYIYVASIPFFVGLLQAFKLVDLVEKNKIFSQPAIKAVRNIKFCAVILVGFIVSVVIYIFVATKATNEDPIGFGVIGAMLIIIASIIAYFAAKLQKQLQNAARLKK